MKIDPQIISYLKMPEFKNIVDSVLSMEGHKLETIIQIFDQETGKPIDYTKVISWPCTNMKIDEDQRTNLKK